MQIVNLHPSARCRSADLEDSGLVEKRSTGMEKETGGSCWHRYIKMLVDVAYGIQVEIDDLRVCVLESGCRTSRRDNRAIFVGGSLYNPLRFSAWRYVGGRIRVP